MQNAYNVEGSKKLFTKAIDKSTDLNDKVTALRGRAILLFIIGQPDAGRVDFQKALSVFSDYGNIYNEYTKKSTHIWTELNWAAAEAGIGSKDLALQHISNAESYLSGLIAGPGTSQLKNQIDQQKNIIISGSNLTIPPSVSSLTKPSQPSK